MRFPKKDYREKIWDHCAGAVIVEEAGAVISDAAGQFFCLVMSHNSLPCTFNPEYCQDNHDLDLPGLPGACDHTQVQYFFVTMVSMTQHIMTIALAFGRVI